MSDKPRRRTRAEIKSAQKVLSDPRSTPHDLKHAARAMRRGKKGRRK